jgi:hypothetical protein
MPIQITELNISVSVHQPGTQSQNTDSTQGVPATGKTEDVVAECVEQVVKILRDKKER